MQLQLKTNIGRRILAALIDYAIIFTVTYLYLSNFGTYDPSTGGYTANGLMALPPFLYWVVMTAGLESGFGATIGNTIAGLKPVPLKNPNNKIGFMKAFVRHLFDLIDMSFFGLVGILVIKSTQNHQRVGDIVAGTVVVRSKQNTSNNLPASF